MMIVLPSKGDYYIGGGFIEQKGCGVESYISLREGNKK